MVNYYKQFETFKNQFKSKEMSLDDFKQQMMIFFGFGGRSKTIDRWITNFNDAKLIEIKKDKDNRWNVIIK